MHPWQSVFFYYAYRIDCMTLPGANFIGSGCPGSGPGGVCKFDEFVKWIQDDGHPWTGHTSIGDNLDPDVWEASNELRASGCQNKYDAHKLFPALYPPGSVPSYEALMEEMVHSFQSDRRLWTDAAKLRSQLKNIRKAFGLVYEARTGAMADKLVQAVDKLLKHRKIGMVCPSSRISLHLLIAHATTRNVGRTKWSLRMDTKSRWLIHWKQLKRTLVWARSFRIRSRAW